MELIVHHADARLRAVFGRCERRKTRRRRARHLRYVPPMDDADGYFGERVAATYDDSSHTFEPGLVEPTVNLLAAMAGHWNSRSAPGASRCRWRRVASRCTASTCRGPWSPGCAPSRAGTRST